MIVPNVAAVIGDRPTDGWTKSEMWLLW